MLLIFESLPSWERGLKYLWQIHPILQVRVAPLVGAWIEININECKERISRVAPLVGAWIEIPVLSNTTQTLKRRSPRGSVD